MRRAGWALALALGCGPGEGDATDGAGTAATSMMTSTAGASTTDAGSTGAGSTTTTGPTTGDASATTADVPIECQAFGNAGSFDWEPQLFDETGVANCTVLEPKPITLDCTGAFTGMFILHLTGGFLPGLVADEAVEVDFRTEIHEEFVEMWLRLRSGAATKLVLGQALTVAPPDAPADWFPTNVAVTPVDVACPEVACDDGSGLSYTKQGLSFGEGDQVITLEAAGTGQIPGRFGGETYMADVREARLGACGITSGDITSWYAFAVVRTEGP